MLLASCSTIFSLRSPHHGVHCIHPPARYVCGVSFPGQEGNMQRRGFLRSSLAAALLGIVAGRGHAAQQVVKDMKGIEELQKNWKLLLAEGVKVPQPSEPLKLSPEEWRKRLAPMAYSVLRD